MNLINTFIKQTGSVSLMLITILSLAACDSQVESKESTAEFLTNARNYQARGQYQAAIIEVRNAMQLAPDDTQGIISLAEIYIEIGEAKGAVKLLEEVEANQDVVMTLAKAYSKSGKLRSATELLDEHGPALTGREQEVKMLRANIATARNELDSASDMYNEVLAVDETNTEAMLGLASIAATRGELDTVKSQLATILKIEPKNPLALLFSSSIKIKEGDLVAAEALLRDALSSVPTSDVITPLRYSILSALRDNLTEQGLTSEALIYSGMLSESMPGVEEINEKFQAAMDALEQSDFEGAQEMLEDIQAEAPGFERAGAMLGVVEYLQGDNNAAVTQFEQFLDPETANPVAMQLFAMAELKLNQPEKVLTRLKDDIDDSTDAKLVALYGIAAMSSGDSAKGEKYLLKAIELAPDNGRLRFPLVKFYNRQDRRAEALAQVRLAFKSQPDDSLVQSGLVQQLILMGKRDETAEAIKGIRASYPNSQESQLLVARYYANFQQLGEALKVLQKVLDLGESLPAHLLTARIELSRKNYAEAERSYMVVLKLDPENSDAYKGLITVYEMQEKVESGLALVKKIAKENGAENPILVLGEYYGRNGNYEEAFSTINTLDAEGSPRALQLSQIVYLAKASQEFQKGELKNSRKTILEGLSKAPDNIRLMALLVSVELSADSLGEAEKVLEQLQKLVPTAPLISILAGDFSMAKDEYGKAVDQYRKAWGKAPTDHLAGKIYRAILKGGGHDVVEFLQEWNDKMPGSQLADLALSGYNMESGDIDTARRSYERLLESNDNIAVAHNNLAWIYGEKEIDKAVSAAERAYELAPLRGEIVDTYAWFLYKSGDVDQAKELISKAVELSPENEDIQQHFDEIRAR